MSETDEHFYDRADAHINLSNDQLADISSGKVSASMMYATSRFHSWLSACWCESKTEMLERREENIEYFVESFRNMLEENMDDYIENFHSYMHKGET